MPLVKDSNIQHLYGDIYHIDVDDDDDDDDDDDGKDDEKKANDPSKDINRKSQHQNFNQQMIKSVKICLHKTFILHQ